MIQNEVLSQFINDDYHYKFSHGPNIVRSKEQAQRDGINCVSLAHLALRELRNITLPSELMCAELHQDRTYFDEVSDSEMITGDLVWFGIENPPIEPHQFIPLYENGELTNWREYPVKHVAIATGEVDYDGDPLLLHSTNLTGTNTVWPMRLFANYRRYKQIYGITRLKGTD